MVMIEECRKTIQEHCKYSFSHKLKFFYKTLDASFERSLLRSATVLRWCTDKPWLCDVSDGSYRLAVAHAVETELCIGSVFEFSIETIKAKTTFISCINTSLHKFCCRDKYLHSCFFALQPQYTQSSKHMFC